MLRIAISKGRVHKAFIALLEQAGFTFDQLKTRKLIIEDSEKRLQLIEVKAPDVPLYVDKGFADIGIVGSDVLLEYSDAFYELLDLKIGVCDLCLAAKPDFERSAYSNLRIATKYERQAERYLEKIGVPGEIIKLNGSVELGPLLEISDCIIDIVETGRTLRENNLVVKETLRSVSSRLIANKVSYKLNHRLIDQLIADLKPFLEVTA